MKISKITIKNFKSIQEIEINCNDGENGNGLINAFIGKNGTGKSAVFDAVNFLIGDGSYPSLNTCNKEWYIEGKEKECFIEVQTSCGCFKFDTSKESYHFTYNNKAASNETRDKIKINFLSSDRTIKSIMPTNGWSLLGKHFYNESFFGKELEAFHKLMQSAKEQLKQNSKFSEFLDTVTNELSSQIGRKIEADSEIYDIKHFLKGLEFYTNKNEQKINLVNEGSGIQNSFIIACLRALATHRGTDNNPIFIDEPELYLHPHAKKSLYNTLKKLSEPIIDENGVCISEGIQIFYITHSSEFLSYENSEQIHRFYIDGKNGTKSHKFNKVVFNNDCDNDIENNKISFNNAFFADIVCIVEGFSDYLFLKYIIECKNNTGIDELNISIINATRKSKIKSLYSVYSNFGIQTFALYDKDNKPNTEADNHALFSIKAHGFDCDLETYLGYNVTQNKDETKGEAKVRLMREWIESLSTEQKQSKIDEIYKEVARYIPSLKHNNDYVMTQDDNSIVIENTEHIVVNW